MIVEVQKNEQTSRQHVETPGWNGFHWLFETAWIPHSFSSSAFADFILRSSCEHLHCIQIERAQFRIAHFFLITYVAFYRLAKLWK